MSKNHPERPKTIKAKTPEDRPVTTEKPLNPLQASSVRSVFALGPIVIFVSPALSSADPSSEFMVVNVLIYKSQLGDPYIH